MMSGCSSGKKLQRTNSQKPDTHIHVTLSKQDNKMLKEVDNWLGVPYKYGGNDHNGVDCSGLVLQLYNRVYEIKLPRTCAQQAEFCQPIDKSKVKFGDLVFFSTGDNKKINHVGMMLDSDNFIHASSSKGVVISSMNNDYYIRRFRMYGRIPH